MNKNIMEDLLYSITYLPYLSSILNRKDKCKLYQSFFSITLFYNILVLFILNFRIDYQYSFLKPYFNYKVRFSALGITFILYIMKLLTAKDTKHTKQTRNEELQQGNSDDTNSMPTTDEETNSQIIDMNVEEDVYAFNADDEIEINEYASKLKQPQDETVDEQAENIYDNTVNSDVFSDGILSHILSSQDNIVVEQNDDEDDSDFLIVDDTNINFLDDEDTNSNSEFIDNNEPIINYKEMDNAVVIEDINVSELQGLLSPNTVDRNNEDSELENLDLAITSASFEYDSSDRMFEIDKAVRNMNKNNDDVNKLMLKYKRK